MNEESRAAAKVKAEQDTQALTDEVRELLARKRQRTEAAFMEECRMLELARQKFNESAPPNEESGPKPTPYMPISVYGQIINLLQDFTDPELIQVLRIAEQIKLDRERAA